MKTEEQVFAEGREAYAKGKSDNDNPYNVLHKEFNWWNTGYYSWAPR